MRREKDPAWNGGALEQHCRCCQGRHHHHRSGLHINGRDSVQVLRIQHLHALQCQMCLLPRKGKQSEGRVNYWFV